MGRDMEGVGLMDWGSLLEAYLGTERPWGEPGNLICTSNSDAHLFNGVRRCSPE